jgi:hypothetical protein
MLRESHPAYTLLKPAPFIPGLSLSEEKIFFGPAEIQPFSRHGGWFVTAVL